MSSGMTHHDGYRGMIRPLSVNRHARPSMGVSVILACVGLILHVRGVAGTPPCPAVESVTIFNSTQDADGSIEFNGIVFGPSQYYIENDTVFGCVCLVRQCLHICCPESFLPGETCSFAELNVNFSSADGTSHITRSLLNDPAYHMIYVKPNCSGNLLALEGDEYVMRSDGKIAYGHSIYDYRHYCLQGFEGLELAYAGYCEMVDVLAMHRLYSVGIIISLPFLVATFVVYALLPEMQNIPGKSLMCYVACLTISYFLLALMRLSLYGHQSNACIISGYTVYTTLLASFFWLNVMAFDIFWTFGGSRGRSSERRKFAYYSAYAWGCPVLILIFVAVLDNTEFVHHSFRPQFGTDRCFFSEGMLIGFLYMYLPLLLLISANVLFFTVTAVRIYRMEQATASALSGESRRHAKYDKERNRFSLYLRLFIIMGVTWTVEIITWLIGGSSWLIYLVDICNCLTGIFIFVLFVWKQKVKELLLKRFGCDRAAPRNEHCTNSTISTTRSTDLKATANTEVPLTDVTHGN